MAVKVAINGFGRIGRLAFRRIQDVEGIDVVAVNDLTDDEMLAHLLKYDTMQGRFTGEVEVENDGFRVNGQKLNHSQNQIQISTMGRLRYRCCFRMYWFIRRQR